jgi:hypothetical protein
LEKKYYCHLQVGDMADAARTELSSRPEKSRSVTKKTETG